MDTGDRSKHVNVGVRDAGAPANTELRDPLARNLFLQNDSDRI